MKAGIQAIALAGSILAMGAMQPCFASSDLGTTVNATASVHEAPKAGMFSAAEIVPFLDAAKKAEAIKDPLQRCLSYPDPPGSHWSPAATHAYCVFRAQSIMSYTDMRSLIQNGHAADLDRYMRDALQKQRTRPESAGLLDYIYFGNFSDASKETRALIDAWKKQSPKSAFAYVASGSSYLRMAWNARGERAVSDTPRENFVAMDKWLALGKADLDEAIKLDPHIVFAYSMLIDMAMLTGDDESASGAAERGLAMEPTNYALYGQMIWKAEPKWGGSIQEMSSIAHRAQAYATKNPLLKLLLPRPAAYAANLTDCDCSGHSDENSYRVVLDDMPAADVLAGVATVTNDRHLANLAVVYQSELLRFSPWLDRVRLQRAPYLAAFRQKPWAMEEMAELSARSRKDADTLAAFANAYMFLQEPTLAESQYQQIIAMDPANYDIRYKLGELYVMFGQWDKSWATAEQMIKNAPDNPNGWLLRALVQLNQPRTGLSDTMQYLQKHFADNDEVQGQLKFLREASVSKSQEAASKIGQMH
jgi:tetratricopeptide (TPR) repeat protein